MSGPSARGEPWALPRLDPKLFLKVPAAFIAAIALAYVLAGPYTRAVVFASDRLLRVTEGADRPVLRPREDHLEIATRLVPKQGGDPRVLRLEWMDVQAAFWNGIVFLTLIGATPLARLRRRPRMLAGSAGILFLSHVAFSSAAAFLALEAEYATVGYPRRSEGFLLIFGGAAHIYGTIIAPFLPFLLMAPIWFGSAGHRKKGSDLRTAGRNDPCPCGSGRKFKRCCGA